MPALAPTISEGTLAKWLVREGDVVEVGTILAEIETEKATMEIEAQDTGCILRLLVAQGSQGVKVNTPIALIEPNSAHPIGPDHTQATADPSVMSAQHEASGPDSGCRPTDPVQAQESQPPPVQPPPVQPQPVQPQPAQPLTVRRLTMREAIRDAMAEEMRRDRDVFLIGEEVAQAQSAFKVSQGLVEAFGQRRVVDTPITGHAVAGLAVGAAFAGLKPIVEVMNWSFAMQAMDQIVNSAAKTRYRSGGHVSCPIVFRGPNGAAPRVGAQHAQCFSAWYAHVPGLKVVAPHSAADAKGLLKAAIRDPDPVILLESEPLYGRTDDVPQDPEWVVPIGKAQVVRDGDEVTVVSFGRAMDCVMAAADDLNQEGIAAEVVDLRSLRPIDWPAILRSVRKTGRLVTVEDGWPVGSIGSQICAHVATEAFSSLRAAPLKVTGADVPMPYAANLERVALPAKADVVGSIKRVCRA